MQQLKHWADRMGFAIDPHSPHVSAAHHVFATLATPQLAPIWSWITENIRPISSFNEGSNGYLNGVGGDANEHLKFTEAQQKHSRIKTLLEKRNKLRSTLNAASHDSTVIFNELRLKEQIISNESKEILELKDKLVFADSFTQFLDEGGARLSISNHLEIKDEGGAGISSSNDLKFMDEGGAGISYTSNHLEIKDDGGAGMPCILNDLEIRLITALERDVTLLNNSLLYQK